MLVAIAGGHGKIARRLTHLLVAHGDQVRGLIRNPDHAADLRADGAEPVVCDLEHEGVAEIARAIARRRRRRLRRRRGTGQRPAAQVDDRP